MASFSKTIRKNVKGVLTAVFLASASIGLSAGTAPQAQAQTAVTETIAPAAEARAPESRQTGMEIYSNNTYLAYIRSPVDRINQTADEGLSALVYEVDRRTSVEPDGVVGLDIERDSLIYFPLIYFPISAESPPLSEAAQEKLQDYLNNGGLVLIDIVDAGVSTQQNEKLRRVLGAVQTETLTPVTRDSTVSKSFFLLDSMRGTTNFGQVFQEVSEDDGRENTTSVIIGENRWAAAWAGRTWATNSREYELAIRTGVNLVMYALTGEYKSDQVHVQSILNRMR